MTARLSRILLLSLVLACLLPQTCVYADNCIGQIKTLDPATAPPLTLTDKVVTGVFGGSFYIQDTQAGHTSCGIMVKSTVVPMVANKVTVNGALAVDPDSDELCISASSVDITGTAALPKTYGCINKNVGGATIGSAQGPQYGGGPNTVGVLQTTWGRASNVVKGQSMTIDDGSHCPINVIGPIYCINNNDYVRVTGIASIEKAGSTHTRVLRIRDYKDSGAPGVAPPVPTDPLIDLAAADLATGDIAYWSNRGTLGGIFGADGTTPNVGVVAGKKCVTFADTDRMKASFLAPAGITGRGDYSVVFWAYKTSLWPEMPILSWAPRNGTAGTCATFNFGNIVGTGAATHGTDPFDLSFGTLKPSTNFWHQVAVTYDGTTEKCYLDGLLSNSKAKTLAIAAGRRVYVGCGYSFDGAAYTPDVFLPGSVASLQVYDYSLSATQIGQSYASVVNTHAIRGVVKAQGSNTVINGAKVYLSKSVPASADPAFLAIADANGAFSCTLPAGVWHTLVSAALYETSGDLTVDLTNSDLTNVTFYLIPRPTTEVVNLDAASLSQGPLVSCQNLGAQPGSFSSEGTSPVVETISGAPAITFHGSDHLRADFPLAYHMTSMLDWSVCAWVYNPSFDPVETIFSWTPTQGAGGTSAQINFGNSATSGAVGHSGWDMGFPTQPSAAAWHHIAVTYGGATYAEKVYVDGTQVKTQSKVFSLPFGGSVFVGCGYRFDGSNYYYDSSFSGSISSLAVYDSVLDAGIVSAQAANYPQAVKVMPLGDSITDGYNIVGGYRIKLWADVQGIGKHINFVGSQSNGPTSLPDKDHEGHPGWQCTDLIANIDGWMDAAKPRIVLIHICTNDISAGASPDTCISRVSTLIDKIYAKFTQYNIQNPKIYVAQIVPRTDTVNNEITKVYNSKIPDLAAQKVAAGKQVYVVNMFGDVVTNPNGVFTTDLADMLHPNQVGYDKMGDLWFNAIKDDIPY